MLLPICIAAYYGLFNWSGYGPLSDFVGLHNYRLVLDDPVFRESVLHNVIIAVLSLLIQLPLSIALALLLNRRLRGGSLLRHGGLRAVRAVRGDDGGAVAADAAAGRLRRPAVQGGRARRPESTCGWPTTSIVLYTLFVVVTWKYIGFGIILLLAGLQGIPVELREAAAIDGASAWQMTRRITLPLLGPTIRIWIFLSMIGSLQLFDIVWIMTIGGPANASSTMVTYMIENGFRSLEFGYGSAVAVILFIISFVFALLYQRFALRRDTAGALTGAVG